MVTKPKDTPDEVRRKRNRERRERRTKEAQRQMLFYVFTLVALGGLYWYAHGDLMLRSSYARKARVVLDEAQKTMLRESEQSIVEPLTNSDIRKLDRQRDYVDGLARRHVGAPPSGGAIGDLYILQSIVDDRVLEKDQTYELQALGVVLGDVLAEQLDLEWVIVDDAYGRTRALQFGSRDDVFFPVTMISKRYEADIQVDVDALFRKVEAEVERLRLARS